MPSVTIEMYCVKFKRRCKQTNRYLGKKSVFVLANSDIEAAELALSKEDASAIKLYRLRVVLLGLEVSEKWSDMTIKTV